MQSIERVTKMIKSYGLEHDNDHGTWEYERHVDEKLRERSIKTALICVGRCWKS